MYWNIVSFARMFGVGLFSFGLLIWSIKGVAVDVGFSNEARRGILFALIIASLLSMVTAITQQFSVWSGYAGWAFVLMVLVFSVAYIYYLARMK